MKKVMVRMRNVGVQSENEGCKTSKVGANNCLKGLFGGFLVLRRKKYPILDFGAESCLFGNGCHIMSGLWERSVVLKSIKKNVEKQRMRCV